MVKDFILGIKSYIRAIKFIHKHNFWIYFIFPVIIFIFIYHVGFYFKDLTDDFKAHEDAGFFLNIWYFFVAGIFTVLSYMFLNFIRYIIILLMSPLLSIISQRTERILTGNKYNFNLIQLIKDVKRALNLIIRNLIWEFVIIGVVIIISFKILKIILPFDDSIIDMARSTILTVVAFYYYGFGFIDYIMERLRLNLKESVRFVRKHIGFAIALGAVFTPLFHYTNKYLYSLRDNVEGWLYIVVLIICATIMAIVPIVSMVAATIGINELVDLSNNPYAKKDN